MKLSLSRGLEISKFLATESGKQLADFIQYVADLSENMIRALQNNLTFADNFNCKVSTLSLKHNVEQIVNTDGKRPIGVFDLQTVSTTSAVESKIWYVNSSGQMVLKVAFVGAPSTTLDVTVAILFS